MMARINGSRLTEHEWLELSECIERIEQLAEKAGAKLQDEPKGATLVRVPSKRTFMNGSNVVLVNSDGSVIHGQHSLDISAAPDEVVSCLVEIDIQGFIFEE